MIPSFNIAGPCIAGEHYMLPPERRLGHVLELIDERRFFTLYAGRQTGKTTSARWIVDHLNATEHSRAVWVDIQTAGRQSDAARAMRTLLNECDDAFGRDLGDLARPSRDEREELLRDPETALRSYLATMAERAAPRRLVVLFDEADALVGASMLSFLAQLRRGYLDRARTPFPSSVVLIGQRQVRDYALAEEDRAGAAWLGSSSPFNVTAEAATLAAFTRAEVEELLAQHTAATGQRFEPEAIERIWALALGHPWLTNALADQIVRRDLRDRTAPITAAHVEAAKETIILERRTHIDSLVAKLRDPRVQRIIEPMLVGERAESDMLDDDFAFVLGLGLIVARGGRFEIANPIYREVIPRALSYVQQMQIPEETSWYVRSDGTLDMPKLMAAWQAFWRKDGHLAAEGFGYREAGPHLMLMAFLQRIINGGGRIEREMGLGRGALDLMITWRGARHAVEVKLRRDTATEADALDQIARYLDHAGLDEGWLVMFDLRGALSWSERLARREVEHRGRRVYVIGC